MLDLIERRAALTALCEDCLQKYEGICPHPDSRCVEFRTIKQLPAIEAEPVWIPCSERLPENDAKCLVYTSDKRVCMARWYGKYDEQGAWYIISDDVPKLYRIKNVPFWMPLPEPPEKEDADDA